MLAFSVYSVLVNCKKDCEAVSDRYILTYDLREATLASFLE